MMVTGLHRSADAAAALLLMVSGARAQFETTVPLVLAPATVLDSKGHYVDGLTATDLIICDSDVPQR